MKKIIAIASFGGHWTQLLRITRPLEEHYDIIYISTVPKCAGLVQGRTFHTISDFNRWNIWKLFPTAVKLAAIIIRERPRAILSTGAAPGLVAVVVGRIFGIRTIWVDSIANVQELSGCGKLARAFAHYVYTQWPDLAVGKIRYAGNILGD